MTEIQLFAEPWWVNLLLGIPVFAYWIWRVEGLAVSTSVLVNTACFAVAFGFVESAVVIYLRAAVGLLPGYGGTLSDVARLSSDLYRQSQALSQIPAGLLTVEMARESATMVALSSVALLAAKAARKRFAIFLWSFAIWDVAYYFGLWCTVEWPSSLLTADVLFLIPVPWVAQVWFPLLVSALTISAVLFAGPFSAKSLRMFAERCKARRRHSLETSSSQSLRL